jgi:predicted component of type VI protein secretion system
MKQHIKELINKYEKRIKTKKKQQIYNHNDLVDGIILALEEVIEDLENLPHKDEI